jgi:hypothetical protein
MFLDDFLLQNLSVARAVLAKTLSHFGLGKVKCSEAADFC